MATPVFSCTNQPNVFIDPHGQEIAGTCAGMTLEWVRNVITTNAAMNSNSTKPALRQARLTQQRYVEDPSDDAGHERSGVTIRFSVEPRSHMEVAKYLTDLARNRHPHTLLVGNPATDDAHLVGLLKDGQKLYYFEPNSGMYRCDSARDLCEALETHLPDEMGPKDRRVFQISEMKRELRPTQFVSTPRLLPETRNLQPVPSRSQMQQLPPSLLFHPHTQAFAPQNPYAFSARSQHQQQQHTNALPQGGHARSRWSS